VGVFTVKWVFHKMSSTDKARLEEVDESFPDRQSKRFRFKDVETSGSSREPENSRDSRKRPRRHHHHHHRSRKQTNSTHLSDHPLPQDEATRGLDPGRAFRESLFDALGDDEGAEFWHGVYGQPIHNYPNTYLDEETGEVQQMDDEEYAQFVRRNMWEKSREGIEAAKEEERRERMKDKERQKKEASRPPSPKEAHDNFAFDFEVNASLRRGQRRRDQKRWRELWQDYLERWEELQDLAKSRDREHEQENLFLRNRIAWPVESGKRKDLAPEEIERFIQNGAESGASDERRNRAAFLASLKLERVRWHPDKIQQRYGFMQIDDATMQGVTATFQVFDRMWNELKGSQKD
jgi:hypothetical protein